MQNGAPSPRDRCAGGVRTSGAAAWASAARPGSRRRCETGGPISRQMTGQQADAQRAQQQARDDSKKRNLLLRKARKAAKGAEEKLKKGQTADALRQFKVAYEVFAEAGTDHNKIREKIIALDASWNPAAAAAADSAPPADSASTAAVSAGASAAAAPPPMPAVQKLEISSELADEPLGKLGGERGWADYTPPATASSGLGGSSPSLLQRVHAAAAGQVAPSELAPAADVSTRPGTFMYSQVGAAAPQSGDGDSHLMSVRPVGDQQASALRPPRSRPSSQPRQRQSRSPPPARPGSGQRARESMPTSATPYTTPRAGSMAPGSFTPGGGMFVPQTAGAARLPMPPRFDYSGRATGGYRHRSPSPSTTGRSGWRGTSPFDKRKKQELSVKFDWTKALPSSEPLYHRVRVSLPSGEGEQRTDPEPSWTAVVSQQVSWHRIGAEDVAFSFVDDEEDECRITSEEEWLAALRLQVEKGGTLRVRVESTASSDEDEDAGDNRQSTGLLRPFTLGAGLLALVMAGAAREWRLT